MIKFKDLKDQYVVIYFKSSPACSTSGKFIGFDNWAGRDCIQLVERQDPNSYTIVFWDTIATINVELPNETQIL